MEWLIVMCIIFLAVAPWPWSRKSISKEAKETNHPDACFSCNREDCKGCTLEGLTRAQAEGIMKEMTKRAVEDGAIPYTKRFEGR